MLKETPNPTEEAVANPTEGGESEDEKEFDALFDDVDFDSEEKTPEELRAEVEAFKENAKKNLAKFYSKKGMELGKKKEVATPAPQEAPKSDLEVIFFETKPEAESVADELRQIAEAKGITTIQAWKQETWLQEKAKALYAESKESEENRGRVGSPSSMVVNSKDSQQKAIENRFIENLPPGFSAKTPRY
jgi:hypothetical protein